MQQYDYTVKYRPGKDNPADYMSRHPNAQSKPTDREQKVADEYLNFVTTHATPKALTLNEIKNATRADKTLQAAAIAIKTGTWYKYTECNGQNEIDSVIIRSLHKVRDTLTLISTEDVILRGTQIVIPKSLQDRVIDLAHEGHQGVVKTKRLLREKVWFPNIDKLVEEKVYSCVACQSATHSNSREPLQMTPLPDNAWEELSMDFCGPFPSGDYLLVVIDNYSRYPVVEIIKSTSARAVIPKLDKIFSEYGIPKSLTSDNGPPFKSHKFRQFTDHLGFHHRRITPHWPEANGESERFMRTLEKAIRTAHAEGKLWKQFKKYTHFYVIIDPHLTARQVKVPPLKYFNDQ